MSTRSMVRTGRRSGSSQLVTHVVSIHRYQTAAPRMSVWTRVVPSGWAMSECESWVTANTNTRSKNSSM